MKQKFVFAVVGGDMRQSCLSCCLLEEGREVHALCMEKNQSIAERLPLCESYEMILPQCDAVIFPLPISTDSLTLNAPFCEHPPLICELFRYISPDATVFCGMPSERVIDMAALSGLTLWDYYQREELIVKNCVPTAEGALCIAMQETARTVFGANCLVTGYGRVGKAMTRLLKAVGAKVTVSARRPSDFAWIAQEGADCIHSDELLTRAGAFDIIVNTVPIQLFTLPVLKTLKKDALIIDLASKPGGVDLLAAKQLGVRVIWALSLPGKVAPVSAAEIIKETVFGILSERGVTFE